MLNEKEITNFNPDKDFVDTRKKIPNYERTYGEVGLFFGLFLLILIAFRDTFKIMKKK